MMKIDLWVIGAGIAMLAGGYIAFSGVHARIPSNKKRLIGFSVKVSSDVFMFFVLGSLGETVRSYFDLNGQMRELRMPQLIADINLVLFAMPFVYFINAIFSMHLYSDLKRLEVGLPSGRDQTVTPSSPDKEVA